jgi:hypothetical protein
MQTIKPFIDAVIIAKKTACGGVFYQAAIVFLRLFWAVLRTAIHPAFTNCTLMPLRSVL